jgi:hypothetical protein
MSHVQSAVIIPFFVVGGLCIAILISYIVLINYLTVDYTKSANSLLHFEVGST